jgi:hypothetical protein
VVLLWASIVPAQSPPEASVAPKELPASHNTFVLKAATAVQLRTTAPLSSATAKVGDLFELRVSEAVVLDGQVVIARNARATGHVSEAREHRRLSRPGELALALDDVELITGDKAPIVAAVVKTGNSSSKEAALWGLGAPVVTLGFAAPVTPFLLMATGEESIIPKSTPIRASLTSDVALTRERVDAAQPGPLAEGFKVPAGTSVTLIAAEGFRSNKVATGNCLPMSSAEDVMLGGNVVVRRGANACVEVLGLVPKRRHSEPARLILGPVNVEAVTGDVLPLTPVQVVIRGPEATVGPGWSVLIDIPVNGVMRGADAVIDPGTHFQSAVDYDVVLDPKALERSQPALRTTARVFLILEEFGNMVPSATLYCGKLKLGRVHQKQYFEILLNPGTYSFYTDKNYVTQVSVEATHDYYLGSYIAKSRVRDHLAFARHESTASVLPKLTPERTIDLTNTPPAQLAWTAKKKK